MRTRILVLPISAVVIVAICVYKVSRTYEPVDHPIVPQETKRLAPPFELFDQNKPSQRVRLETFLGRHRILVVFFDGETGAGRDATLLRLRRDIDNLKAADIMVLAVSTALPQENRRAIVEVEEFPFPLLSDPGFAVHLAWGRLDDDTGRTLPAVFLIDRAGNVAWSDKSPQPLVNSAEQINRLIKRK